MAAARFSLNKALFGLLLSALVLGFAPLIHAICVAPSPAMAAAEIVHPSYHALPDGQAIAGVSAIPPTGGDTLSGESTLLGIILVAGGITVALLCATRALARLRASVPQATLRQRAGPWHRPPHRPLLATRISLTELGISRT